MGYAAFPDRLDTPRHHQGAAGNTATADQLFAIGTDCRTVCCTAIHDDLGTIGIDCRIIGCTAICNGLDSVFVDGR